MAQPTPAPGRPDPAAHRVFFGVVYGFLALIWGSVALDGGLQRPAALAAFTVLLLAHGFLHSRVDALRPPWQPWLYLVAQCSLAGALVVLSRGHGMAAALFYPLAGEVTGLLAGTRARALGLGALVLAWAAGVYLTQSPGAFWVQLPWGLLAFTVAGVYAVVFIRQTELRQEAEGLAAQLDDANRQLHAYTVRVEELTVSHERQRMARELHDTLAQGLAGLIMQLEAVDDLLDRGDAGRARAVASRARERARTALAEARTAIQALRSPLERGDLVEAIRRHLDILSPDHGLTCTLAAGPGDLHLPVGVAEQVYRMVQEGLSNVIRHARARQVAVTLSAAGGQVALEIADDGAGFDPAQAVGRPGHFGLVGLEERVRLAGGTLAIDSWPGQGTRLRVSLPAAPAQGGAGDGR